MKRTLATVMLALSSLVAFAQSPAPPKPGAEQKNIDYFNGKWKLDGEFKPGPWGPGGKMTETENNVWMDGGFFLVSHVDFKSAMGDGTGLSVTGYDPRIKKYTYDEYNSVGEIEHATGIFDGTTWTWSSDEDFGGQKMKAHFIVKELSPTSYSFKFEMAPQNSETFNTIMEGKATKSK